MKLKKQQMIIVGVIIIALILVASVAVVMMSNTGDNESNNSNNNGDGTSNGDGSYGDGDGDGDNGNGDNSQLTGNWVDLSSNIDGNPPFTDVHVIGDEVWISSAVDYPYVCYSADGGETFSIQENTLGTALHSIYMKNSNEGYAGGASGYLYKYNPTGTPQ